MRAMPFYGQIKDGIFRFINEKIFAAYCRMQKDGDYKMELSRTNINPKTKEQLGYYYAVVVPTAYKQMLHDGNDSIVICIKAKKEGEAHKFKEIPLTEQVVDNMLKEIWAKSKGCEVKSKADMTIEECSELLDVSIKWCERSLGCQIPPPEKVLV